MKGRRKKEDERREVGECKKRSEESGERKKKEREVSLREETRTEKVNEGKRRGK